MSAASSSSSSSSKRRTKQKINQISTQLHHRLSSSAYRPDSAVKVDVSQVILLTCRVGELFLPNLLQLKNLLQSLRDFGPADTDLLVLP